jgi:hypothetical protein
MTVKNSKKNSQPRNYAGLVHIVVGLVVLALAALFVFFLLQIFLN